MSETLVQLGKKYDIKFTTEEAIWRVGLLRDTRKQIKSGEILPGIPFDAHTLRMTHISEINNHRLLVQLQSKGVTPNGSITKK